MNFKMKVKIATDIAMTILLILLMAYELVGQAAHEWLGVGMFVFAGYYLSKAMRAATAGMKNR